MGIQSELRIKYVYCLWPSHIESFVSGALIALHTSPAWCYVLPVRMSLAWRGMVGRGWDGDQRVLCGYLYTKNKRFYIVPDKGSLACNHNRSIIVKCSVYCTLIIACCQSLQQLSKHLLNDFDSINSQNWIVMSADLGGIRQYLRCALFILPVMRSLGLFEFI